MKCSLGISNFLEEILSFPFYRFPLFLCTDHWGRLSYLSLVFFGTLHSNGYICPFLLCLLLLFFSQLFVRPPQTAILLFCISGFRKGKGTRDQIANIHWIIEKVTEFQKIIYFCFIDYAKTFDCVDHNKLWKILKEMGMPDHLSCLVQNAGLDEAQDCQEKHQ